MDETFRYLGIEFSPRGICSFPLLGILKAYLKRIDSAPWSRHHKYLALKDYALTKLQFGVSKGLVNIKELRQADSLIRDFVRKWSGIFKDTPLSFYYARTRDGGLGLVEYERSARVWFNNRVEKLKRSHDPVIKEILRIYHKDFEKKIVSVRGVRLNTNERITTHYRTDLLAKVDTAGLANARHGYNNLSFLKRNDVSLRDWEFCVALQTISSSVTTPSKKHRYKQRPTNRCDHCSEVANLSHILQGCPKTQGLRIHRHDTIQDMLVGSLVKLGFDVNTQNYIPVLDTFIKPDIILQGPNKTIVIDPSIVSDKSNLIFDYRQKLNKYGNINAISAIRENLGLSEDHEVVVIPFISSWRGIMFSTSVNELRRHCKIPQDS
ncbi:Uncharacterized protein FKW44_023110 [Caligus rogercresseyi]|uniref:Retrovirus-related Pol polyprotein from type-1 retrotransposable element R2 n=1 Tax=Caligus rogercresseyi TaxID=217165 RepID=A0A7T8GNH4_CALRO|nr:Uncharacterized protein FKW44_023110 [Caligus rogercresseyi]